MSHKRKNLLDELNKLAPSEAEKLINQYAKSKNIFVPKSLVTAYALDIEKTFRSKSFIMPLLSKHKYYQKGKRQNWIAEVLL